MSEALRKSALQALSALEAHGQAYPHMVKGYCVDAICELRAALVEPEQSEPVAWQFTNTLGGVQVFTSEPPPGLKEKCVPLYTAAPPCREPLSDAQIQQALEDEFLGGTVKRNWGDDLRVVRAIEAAHGITGGKE